MKHRLLNWLRRTPERNGWALLTLAIAGLAYFFEEVLHVPYSRFPVYALGVVGGLAYFRWILYPLARERDERERQEYERRVREYEQQRQDRERAEHERRTKRPKRRLRYRRIH